MRILISLLLLFSLSCQKRANDQPQYVFLTWAVADTSHTMNVRVITPLTQKQPTVYYDTVSRNGRPRAYKFKKEGVSKDFREGQQTVHSIELDGLEPGRTYYYLTEVDRLGRERKFQTVPIGKEIRFVTGGDLSTNLTMQMLLDVAAKQRPQFALLGGDLAYANGLLKNARYWKSFFHHWQEKMVTPDGFDIPMVAAIGNHEVRGNHSTNPQDAPFYFAYLSQSSENRTYFKRYFGNQMVTYALDSGHIHPHDGAQAAWLERQFKADQKRVYKTAIYHVALFPTYRPFDYRWGVYGREHWLPLFDQYNLTVAFENNEHTLKRSKLIRDILFIGDGAWGRQNRKPRKNIPYVEVAKQVNHIWSIQVDANRATYQALSPHGKILDEHVQLLASP